MRCRDDRRANRRFGRRGRRRNTTAQVMAGRLRTQADMRADRLALFTRRFGPRVARTMFLMLYTRAQYIAAVRRLRRRRQ